MAIENLMCTRHWEFSSEYSKTPAFYGRWKEQLTNITNQVDKWEKLHSVCITLKFPNAKDKSSSSKELLKKRKQITYKIIRIRLVIRLFYHNI